MDLVWKRFMTEEDIMRNYKLVSITPFFPVDKYTGIITTGT